MIAARADEKSLTIQSEIEPAIRLSCRPAHDQADRHQTAIQCREVHTGRRTHHRARTHRDRTRQHRDRGHRPSVIPKTAPANLGKPFEQVESQLTKTHRGSGLGLAIAKSLTELHGGAMRIRSTPNVGTIVLVRLPLNSARLCDDDKVVSGSKLAL